MALRLYHQVGHNDVWNRDSLLKDKRGDGLILSPVHQAKSKVEKLPAELKQRSIFDPQYYLPNSQKSKFATYPFFPEIISNGFSTQDFTLVALESARQCVDFQIAQGFEKIIVPTRYIDQMLTDYIDRQDQYTVHPFLKAIAEAKTTKHIFLTLALTSAMVMDKGFRTKLLNWVTAYPEVSGVYVLINNERQTKQIQDADFLLGYLELLRELALVDLGLIVGHTNTESLLFSLIDEITLTCGAYENTRMFSLDKFIEGDEKTGPKARIYLPALLNWIQFGQARDIKQRSAQLWNQAYRPTQYSDTVFTQPVEPHFSKPELYKHYFVCFDEQVKTLSGLNVMQRYELLLNWIDAASELHKQIGALPVKLDPHGNGDHLPHWRKAIVSYHTKYLKS